MSRSNPPSVLALTTLVCTLGFGLVVAPPLASGASFADVTYAGANTVDGGTIDVKLAEVGPASAESTTDESGADVVRETWGDTTHDTLGNDNVSNTLLLDNAESSAAASRVNVTVTFVENDSDANEGNELETARTIEVLEFEHNGTDLTAETLTDQNSNDRLDVEDLTLGSNAENLSSLPGMGPDESQDLRAVFSGSADFLSGVGSGDGIDVTVAIQVRGRGYSEADESRGNAIQYE